MVESFNYVRWNGVSAHTLSINIRFPYPKPVDKNGTLLEIVSPKNLHCTYISLSDDNSRCGFVSSLGVLLWCVWHTHCKSGWPIVVIFFCIWIFRSQRVYYIYGQRCNWLICTSTPCHSWCAISVYRTLSVCHTLNIYIYICIAIQVRLQPTREIRIDYSIYRWCFS